MSLLISPAFDASNSNYTIPAGQQDIVGQPHSSHSYTCQSSLRPSARPRLESRSTSLRSLALNYADNNPAAIRYQRQRAVRAQCSSSHLREIAELVKRMVDNEDQCSVRSSSYTSSLGSFRSRRNSDASTESVASSFSEGDGFDEEGYPSSDDGNAQETIVEDIDGCDTDLDYRCNTNWLSKRMARCTVAKDVRVRKHHRPRGTMGNIEKR